MLHVFTAPTSNLDARTLYEIMRLRQSVFVLEQTCLYPDLDGRDLEPGTVQIWASIDGRVVGTARLLREAGGTDRIGRVAVSQDLRHAGVGAAVVRAAISAARTSRIDIDAQSYLVEWYSDFGFTRNGDEFLDDGIPHTPMIRITTPAPTSTVGTPGERSAR